MYKIFESIPFGICCALVIIFSGLAIYSMFEINKQKKGNPTMWIFPFVILTAITLLINKYAYELTVNNFFQKTSDIITIVSIALFFLSILITFVIAYIRGYLDKEKVKKVAPMIICGVIFVIFGFLMLTITHGN